MADRVLRDQARFSPSIDQLSWPAECLFYRLLMVADNLGRFRAEPEEILAGCFPLRLAALSLEEVEVMAQEIAKAGIVRFYRVGGKRLGSFIAFAKHNEGLRLKSSSLPPPPDRGRPAAGQERKAAPGRAHRRADPESCASVQADAIPGPEEPATSDKSPDNGVKWARNSLSLNSPRRPDLDLEVEVEVEVEVEGRGGREEDPPRPLLKAPISDSGFTAAGEIIRAIAGKSESATLDPEEVRSVIDVLKREAERKCGRPLPLRGPRL